MTLEELNRIKQEHEKIVQVREIVASEGEKLAKETGYRKQVLVCGGTGCTSSGSKRNERTLQRDREKHYYKYNAKDVVAKVKSIVKRHYCKYNGGGAPEANKGDKAHLIKGIFAEWQQHREDRKGSCHKGQEEEDNKGRNECLCQPLRHRHKSKQE